MTILGRLALLFVVVPLAELAFLIQVGRWVGLLPTVVLVFVTGIAGALLARAEGLRTLWAFRRELASGRLPGQPILDGFAILVGGALLLTPGFLTDIAGFALLIPPSRRLIQRGIKHRLEGMIQDGTVRIVTSSPIFGSGWDREADGPDGPGSPGRGGAGGAGTGRRGEAEPKGLDPDKEIRQ